MSVVVLFVLQRVNLLSHSACVLRGRSGLVRSEQSGCIELRVPISWCRMAISISVLYVTVSGIYPYRGPINRVSAVRDTPAFTNLPQYCFHLRGRYGTVSDDSTQVFRASQLGPQLIPVTTWTAELRPSSRDRIHLIPSSLYQHS